MTLWNQKTLLRQSNIGSGRSVIGLSAGPNHLI
jgi:hypothetical protein